MGKFKPVIRTSLRKTKAASHPRAAGLSAVVGALALTLATPARAEESLANLIWILPMAFAAELYFNLRQAYPWLLGGTLISFCWYAVFKFDLIPFLFDTESRDGLLGGRDWGFNLHRTLAWITGFATIYIVFGSFLISPKLMADIGLTNKPQSASTLASKALPTGAAGKLSTPAVPPGAPPAAPPLHPAGSSAWPTTAAYLTPHFEREVVTHAMWVHNDKNPAPIYIKLCRDVRDASTNQSTCYVQRRFYLPPKSSLFINDLSQKPYRLYYIENLGPTFATGMSKVIRFDEGETNINVYLPEVTPTNTLSGQDKFGGLTRERFDAARAL